MKTSVEKASRAAFDEWSVSTALFELLNGHLQRRLVLLALWRGLPVEGVVPCQATLHQFQVHKMPLWFDDFCLSDPLQVHAVKLGGHLSVEHHGRERRLRFVAKGPTNSRFKSAGRRSFKSQPHVQVAT